MRLLVIFALMISVGANAQMTASEAFDAGKQSGNTANTQNILDNINTTQGSSNVNGYSETPPAQSSYWGGKNTGLNSIYTGGSDKILECDTGTSSQNIQDQQHCHAVNVIMDTNTKKPSNLIDKSDPLILKGKTITADPEAIAGVIDGTYSNCTTSTKPTTPNFLVQTCDDWSLSEKKECSIGQEVVVDPDYIYQCKESLKVLNAGTCTVGRIVTVDVDYNYQCTRSPLKIQTSTCNKTLSVVCDPMSDGCDDGGIVPGSTEADMRVWFGPYGTGDFALEFGTFQDNYWRADPGVFDRTLTFTIANIAKITNFTLINAAFDDWLWVKINGTTVYVGPRGGDQLVLTGTKVWCDSRLLTSCGNAELKTSWNKGLSINLIPYLVNGTNTIWTRTIVSGAGESAIRIKARMMCPQVCHDSWDNQCQIFEQRSQ